MFGAGKLFFGLSAKPPFDPFSEENMPGANKPVPANCSGCYVTLIGAGGAGGQGMIGGTGWRYAGGGGGGGGRILRVWIPRDKLGTNYSVQRGLGGFGVTGGSSQFSSAGTVLIAGGGIKGGDGTGSASPAGAGGTCTVQNVTATTYPGATGGGYNQKGGNSANAAAGGGAGAVMNGNNFYLSTNGGSQPGGDTSSGATLVLGGTANYSVAAGVGNPGNTQTPSIAGGSGGAGSQGSAGAQAQAGAGGAYGGGGGGSGPAASGEVRVKGGDGYTLVEWV
jgi:hypothetical protein